MTGNSLNLTSLRIDLSERIHHLSLMKKPILCLTSLLLFAGSAAFSQKQKDTWTDPAKAAEENPDFTIQGEYGLAEKGQDRAVQVVALGDGKFDAYVLEGGFPGLGFTREKSKTKLSGTAGELKSQDGKVTGKIAEGKIEQILMSHEIFDFRPGMLIKDLGLKTPRVWSYRKSANYGHFGRDGFPWEEINSIDALRSAAGL